MHTKVIIVKIKITPCGTVLRVTFRFITIHDCSLRLCYWIIIGIININLRLTSYYVTIPKMCHNVAVEANIIMHSLCGGGSAFATATVPLCDCNNEYLETRYQRLLSASSPV